ncbi:FAD-binding oxidoreductase [Phyllobacterium sp. LjRoot231]|uniref:FAD-binding oxidoreductase n=1 Tax=Phyllobacterium sp. LjRoot231 TaxID=3342289 RepID=UPI003ECD09C6
MPTLQEDLTREVLTGTGVQAIWPHSSGYDEARRIFNRMHDRYPAVMLRNLSAETVARSIMVARKHDIELTIRGGGHHIAGFSARDKGMMLDFSDDRGIKFDVCTGVASIAPGSRLADVDQHLVPLGLVIPTGTVSETGIAGLTLGGGIGWLTGIHGLTCDHLVAVDLVTADGCTLNVNAETHPELLWALRGGGGNFGVVTRFYFRPVELGQIKAGRYRCTPDNVPGVLFKTLDWLSRSCPRELTVAPVLKKIGDCVFLDIEFCLCGTDLGALNDLLALVRADARSLYVYDDFIAWQRSSDVTFSEPKRGYWKARYLDQIEGAAACELMSCMIDAPNSDVTVTIEHLHGQMGDRDPSLSAFPIHGNKFGVLVASRWIEAENDVENRDWVRNCILKTAGDTHLTYSNYSESGDVPEHSNPHLGRLRTIKRRFDPDNIFRNNHNIRE